MRRLYSRVGLLHMLYAALRLKLAPLVEVEPYVPSEGSVLDLGCGNGMFAHILILGSSGRKVKGVDLDAKRVRTAQQAARGNPNLEFVHQDACSYPVADCDIVTIIDLLHHMKHSAQTALLERVRLGLNKNSVLLIKDLEKKPRYKYWFHYLQDSISYRQRLYFSGAEEMKDRLERMGFTVEIVSLAAGYMHPHVLYRCRLQSC